MERTVINGIPAIVWGKPSGRAYIHVHGKLSCKEHAAGFAAIAEKKGWQTISFDLPQHGERAHDKRLCDVWNGVRDLQEIHRYVSARWKKTALYACSLGAYFSLQTYAGEDFDKCLFQSPIVDMEYLVGQMMRWFDVTEERLMREKCIHTPVDALRWDYYRYIKTHPVEKWDIPTAILYGGRDDMQSIGVMRSFSERFGCSLTVSENSMHPFMEDADAAIVSAWLEENI